MPLATKVICKSELCCLTLKRREFAINFLQIPDKSIFLLKVKLGPWLVLSFTSFANCWRGQNCLLNPDVCVCVLFVFQITVCKGEDCFNEYTIYYHATTTHGHPQTCALFKYTQETSTGQQLRARIHGQHLAAIPPTGGKCFLLNVWYSQDLKFFMMSNAVESVFWVRVKYKFEPPAVSPVNHVWYGQG